jgi:hypothetical protein
MNGGGGRVRGPHLKWPKQKDDRMTSCFLNSLRSFQSRVVPLRVCMTSILKLCILSKSSLPYTDVL